MFTTPLGINYLNWYVSGAYTEKQGGRSLRQLCGYVEVDQRKIALAIVAYRWAPVSYKREKLDIQFFYFRNASTRQIVYIYKLRMDKMEWDL